MSKEINQTMQWEYENSIVRQNIINWYEFLPEGSLLVLGSAGAILLEYLRKKLQIVNTEADIQYGTYDYVFLIEGMQEEFNLSSGVLQKAKRYLNNTGVLIIAMNNPMGMRYWAGAAESSTGVPYVGLEGYAEKKILSNVTRNNISDLLMENGFRETEYYYPMPDYIFPTEIYSDLFLPQQGDIRGQGPAYFGENFGMFHEDRVYEKICRDGLFPYFANSFLIFTEVAAEE